jgi:putative transposase
MPRTARIVIAGCPHHVTQKGNGGQDVFFDDADRRMFLELLRQYSGRLGASVDGYCLMTNHVHLIVVPATVRSLAETMRNVSFRYAQYVNRTHARQGHLWQSRFYSCAMDDAHYWRSLVYVEQNPVRAGIVRKPWQYKWSSAAVHCGQARDGGLVDQARWRGMTDQKQWRGEIAGILPDEELHDVRQFTRTGRPLGGSAFLARIERATKRRVRARPRGRQPAHTAERVD